MNSKIELANPEDIIAKNYTDKEFCINNLAQFLAVSFSYLRDIFYKNYGSCPQQYLEKVRLEHILRIYSPELTLFEMSDNAGFIDVRTFRRAFHIVMH